MKYRLIAVDVDGTLLNSRKELTGRTRLSVSRAVERGALVVISTGRPMAGVAHLGALFPSDMPFILYNGAEVTMGRSGRKLYERPLSAACARQAVALGRARGAAVVVWRDGGLYVTGMDERIEAYRKLSGVEPVVAGDMDDLVKNGVSKVLWCDSPDRIAAFREEAAALLRGRANCHTSSATLLEFVDIEASKALALERIGRAFGIAREEMIAVGDGENDLSMIEYAGLGVAMANAPAGVREKADYLTLSNDEDGVAAVIDLFILQEKG